MQKVSKLIFNAIVGKIILKAVLIIFAALIAATPFCVTKVYDYELVTRYRWGKLIDEPVESGLKWFWPIMNTVEKYDTRERHIEENGDEYFKVEVVSYDEFNCDVLASVHYSLNKAKGFQIIKNYGKDDNANTRDKIEKRIKDEVTYAIQNLCPRYRMEYLIKHRAELIYNIKYLLGYKDSLNTHNGFQGDKGTLLPFMDERLSNVGIELEYIQLEFKPSQIYITKREVNLLKETKDSIYYNEELLSKKAALEIMKDFDPVYIFLEKWDGVLPKSYFTDDGMLELAKKSGIKKSID